MTERSQDVPNLQKDVERASSSGTTSNVKPKKNAPASNMNWEELFIRQANNPIVANLSFRVGKDGTPVPVIPFVLASRCPFFECLLSKNGITEKLRTAVEDFLSDFEPEVFQIFLNVRFDGWRTETMLS
jgi:hypothetical protein